MPGRNNFAGQKEPGTSFQLILGFLVIGTVGVSIAVSPGVGGLLGALLGAIMIAIAVVDGQSFIIPDELVGAAGLLGLLFRALMAKSGTPLDTMAFAIFTAIVASAPFWLLMIAYRAWRNREGLGLGDVKLAAAAGVWLDWTTFILVVEIAALTALAVALFANQSGRDSLTATTVIPFGLFFAPAIWLGWLWEAVIFVYPL